jgi:hypothetical protein
MATKILIKKSVTGGASPLTSDLDQGELAINLVDQKIYTKDNANNIVEITGAYVDTVAPANPVEGDIWYDSANNTLKAYDGCAFQSAGYQNLADLEDVTITSIASGEILKWNGSAFVNNTLAEAGIAATSHTHTASEITDFETAAEALFSVTDAGGDGSLAYSAGVFTYTGPSAAEVQAHITGGTGVGVAAGVVSIGQEVETTSNVTFGKVTTDLIEGGSTITIDPAGLGDNTGTVVIDGDLTVNGTTTTVNSNEVNIGDAIILLNADETGAASQNAGFEVERGTDANVSFIWNESDNKWDLADEELQNVILDGGSY